MFTLATGETLRGVGGSATSITYTITGDEKATADVYKTLVQGQLPAAAASLGGPTGSNAWLVQTIFGRNTTAGNLSFAFYINGVAGLNQIFAGVVPANGSFIYGRDGWQIYDANGQQLFVGGIGPQGLQGEKGWSPVLAAVADGARFVFQIVAWQGGAGTPPSSTNQFIGSAGIVATAALAQDIRGPAGAPGTSPNAFTTITGNSGTATADTASDSLSVVGTGPLTVTASDNPEVLTLISALATTVAAGDMSALDKLKLDNAWIDVTANTIALCTPSNTAAANVTAINAIMAAAPGGATIYFPGGTYNFNAAWTVPAKQFVFQGSGSGLSGGYTILAWTSNVGGDLIALQNLIWYTEFQNLTFVSSGVTQTAGAVININGNAFIKIQNCSFGAIGGGFLFNLMNGPSNTASLPLSDNSWNQSVISNCIGTQYKGTAIIVNSRGSSLVMENSTFNGQWGTTAQCAVAGINGKWVGALQTTACDIIGHQNNMLFDPTAASSEVCASVHITNTYFDLSLGSCIKVSGTGATVRMKFDTCTFTTSNGGTGFSAVELAGSFVYPTGGQDIAFVNCNIYNTFATTGTTNAVLITNAADVSFVNVKVAGWTNGYNITPMALNKTNVQIIGGTVGPSGGFGGNSVGFLIAAGAYKGLQIRANNCVGNTTAITLGAVTVLEAAMFAITENAGINPRGNTGIAAPALGTTATVHTNATGFRIMAFAKMPATSTTTLTTGGATTGAMLANQVTTLVLEPGQTAQWNVVIPASWVWVGL